MSNPIVNVVRQYRELDDQLKELNSQVFKLREARKQKELELADFLKSPEYSSITKLEIKDDGSYIKIQKPEAWTKPWSLSAKELGTLLNTYFAAAARPTAEECYKFIVSERKKTMIAREFAFTRITAKSEQEEDV